MSNKFTRLLFTTTALALAIPSMAFAQEAPAAADETAENDVIIVNARRSDERLQDVPVSVQVVAGDKLEATGSFKVGPGTKAVAVVTVAGKPSTARWKASTTALKSKIPKRSAKRL